IGGGDFPYRSQSIFCPPAGDRVELRDRFRRKLQRRSLEIFAEMLDRRRAGGQQNIGCTLKQPRERNLHWRRAHGYCNRIQLRRLQRRESSEREEWHVRHALPSKLFHKGIIVSLSDVEEVLYADDLRYLLRLRELPRCDIAEPEMTDQPMTLK